MKADRHDVLVTAKPRPLVIVASIVLLLAVVAGYSVYRHNVMARQAAIDSAQQRLDYLKGKQSDITRIGKEIGAQWVTFDTTINDASSAGQKRHDGFLASTLSSADGKILAQKELSDIKNVADALEIIAADDTKLSGIYQTLYGSDATSAFTRDTERRNEDYTQMQTYWWRAAQDNVDNITAQINGDDAPSSDSDIEHAYDQSDNYANMAKAAQIDVTRDAKVIEDRLSDDIKKAKAALAKLQ